MPYKDPKKLKEYRRKHSKAWAVKHREILRKNSKLWRKNNPEREKANSAQWYQNNKEERKIYLSQYLKKNPEKIKAYYNTRRTKKSGAGGSFTSVEWIELCNRYGNLCLACGKKRKLTADHVVPVSKGGTSNIANIQPLCGPCNSRKHDGTTDFRRKCK
jgi:5-methylcytosine-specific restriction endonuclease McrA